MLGYIYFTKLFNKQLVELMHISRSDFSFGRLAFRDLVLHVAGKIQRNGLIPRRGSKTDNQIKLVSNQIDIYFKPSSDPKRAADFQCTIVVYEETNLNSRPPTITTKQVRIDAYNSNEFYGEIDQFLNRWFTKPVGRDAPGHPRRVKVYMTPYPGEGVYEQIKQMAEKSVIRNCVVVKTEGTWESAWTE